ncbi:MAG TPA: hypothetical protein VFV95_05480 [Vicinamibacterales bacterium]|nr:hypothetical protein [Vicinamibacterales bacterium]
MKLRDRSTRTERREDGGDAAVREQLRMLAAAERDAAAPAHVEWQVMRAWDQAHPPPLAVNRSRTRWLALPAAAAVALACAVTLARFAQPRPAGDLGPPSLPPRPVNALAGMRDQMPGVHEAEPLVPARARRARRVSSPPPQAPQAVNVLLVGTPVTPGEQMRVVRVRIARASLSAIGLRAVGTGDGETVDVDMLVGEDGVARGLRVGM